MGRFQIVQRSRFWLLALAAGGLLWGGLTFFVVDSHAQTSRLHQHIGAPTCAAPEDCRAFAPTIESVASRAGRPLVAGRYDAALMQSLRIVFNDRAYVHGVDSELTTRNGQWSFDLGSLVVPLSSGVYLLTVEVTGFDGEVQYATADIVVERSDSAVEGESAAEDEAGLATTGQGVAMAIGAGGLLIGISIVLFAAQMKRKRESARARRAPKRVATSRRKH